MSDDRTREKVAIGLVVGLACVLGGGYLLVDAFGTATGTEEVDATVLETDVSSPDTGTYRVHVTYEYSYGDETYTSDNVFPEDSSGEGDYASQGGAEEFLADYPEGETVTAHVDPDDPASAHLEREIRGRNLLTYVVVVLLGLVALGSAGYQLRSQGPE